MHNKYLETVLTKNQRCPCLWILSILNLWLEVLRKWLSFQLFLTMAFLRVFGSSACGGASGQEQETVVGTERALTMCSESLKNVNKNLLLVMLDFNAIP